VGVDVLHKSATSIVCPEVLLKPLYMLFLTDKSSFELGGGSLLPPNCVQKKYRSCQKCMALSLQNVSFA